MQVIQTFTPFPKPETYKSPTVLATKSNKVPKNIFTNLVVKKKLSDSRFPVFLVFSPDHNKLCALKLFPYREDKINISYLNESRYQYLSHPNVVPIIATTDKQISSCNNKKFKASCILMEFAPYGDFATLIVQNKIYLDQTLVRTFFHQLVEGLEYIHSKQISHMDIKLENLLLGEDFNLKITDFDMSYKEGDFSFRGKGTANYRAPELKHRKCEDAKAADVYSAGIILFALVTGAFPYIEKGLVEGHDLFDLLMKEYPRFWEIHQEFLKKKVSFSEDFKELFKMMVKCDPNERATLEQVKKSAWYNGPIYTTEEVVTKLSQYKLINKKN